MRDATFQRPSGGLLTIGSVPLLSLDAYRQVRESMAEAGGILLGRLIDSSQDVVVDEAAPPHAEDRKSRFSFFRRKRPAQERVNRAWTSSSGTLVYLGEWHTHPEDDPQPSAHDLAQWKRILCEVVCGHDPLFFLIVGRVRIRCWEGSRSTGALVQLESVG